MADQKKAISRKPVSLTRVQSRADRLKAAIEGSSKADRTRDAQSKRKPK